MCFGGSPSAPTNPAPVPVDESYKLVDFEGATTKPPAVKADGGAEATKPAAKPKSGARYI